MSSPIQTWDVTEIDCPGTRSHCRFGCRQRIRISGWTAATKRAPKFKQGWCEPTQQAVARTQSRRNVSAAKPWRQANSTTRQRLNGVLGILSPGDTHGFSKTFLGHGAARAVVDLSSVNPDRRAGRGLRPAGTAEHAGGRQHRAAPARRRKRPPVLPRRRPAADPRPAAAHRRAHRRQRHGRARVGQTAIPQRRRRLGRGRLCLPAAGGRRGRPPADARSASASIEGQIQRARAGEGAPTSRPARRVSSASLVEQERPEHLHDLGRQHRAGREDRRSRSSIRDRCAIDARHASRCASRMVVGPRYIPGDARPAAPAGTRLGADTDRGARCAAASRRRCCIRAKARSIRSRSRSSSTPGFPLARVDSRYHPIVHDASADGRVRDHAGRRRVPADRDFELDWTPEPSAAPTAGLFARSARATTSTCSSC